MQIKSLKTLLADYDVSFDANTIMNALIKSGHAENYEYSSTTGNGVMKSFKKLTEAGERFGANKPTMHTFKTEPRFYEETFIDLLQIVVSQLQHEVSSMKTSAD